jgi:prolipoprotein diacylglyceryl transferase
VVLASIPSPSQGTVHLGPFSLRGYALMIAVGVLVAIAICERRLRARGQPPGLAADVATWAVPFGIVGARLYHVVTSPDQYFGRGGQPLRALEIWRGGLGIWGAVAGGALGAWIVCRRRGVGFAVLADAAAPAIAVAQAIGRWGNWFNQELYGRPTDLPWAVRITKNPQVPGVELYHPTFLYESLWNLGVAGVLVWVDRRHRLGRGRLFALYVMLYTAGRAWIEALRIDDAHHVLGLRLNDWVSVALFLAGLLVLLRRRRGRAEPEADGPEPEPEPERARQG